MQKRTARRIISYKGCNKKTSVSTVLVNKRLIKITATMMVAPILSAASTLGHGRLATMHLGGCTTFVNMIPGRWKSAALMEYIHPRTNSLIQ
jgi:hypothetical protein